MDGFINLLKPVGPTSFQAISNVKRITGEKKVGHTGTLDPGASGVLPVCLGRATKLSQIVTDSRKVYRAEITFGIVTDTQDSYGEIISSRPVHIEEEKIKELLKEFEGTIRQIPPMYSAIKQGGRKLYELARKGVEVKRKPRDIEIYGIVLKKYIPPDKAIIQIECSKGTYIRTICHDLGTKSGFGAIMSSLVRISTGGFSLDKAVTIEELREAATQGNLYRFVLPIDYPLQHISKVYVRKDSLKFALNGNRLFAHNLTEDISRFYNGQKLRLYDGQTIIGIGQYNDDTQNSYIRIQKLLTNAGAAGSINK